MINPINLPSLHSLWIQTTKVVARFPLQVLIAIIATGVCWELIDNTSNNSLYETNLFKMLCILNMALTSLLAADLFAEINSYNQYKKWGLRALVIIICVALYLILEPEFYLADALRIGILIFAFHLIVAFAPYIGRDNLNGFWHYNKTLFLRILISAIYAGFLYAGLAIALLAIDSLFAVKIDYKIYLKLLVFINFCFTTIFFLAGLPDDLQKLDDAQDYPKGLKIFTQYVLIPLVSIYLAILLVYELKIAVLWELPNGMVSNLILGYAGFGILSLLLVYPIKNREGNGWIHLFSRFFYVMMVPLVVLLVLAIVKRVGNYGITEPRYYLIILALWLSAIIVYFLFSKKQNIKIIPISLCVLALLSIYGPQSAFSISKYTQISRLTDSMAGKNTVEDESEKASIIRYLVRNHGLASLQSFTKIDLSALEAKFIQKQRNEYLGNTYSEYSKIDTAFNILNVNPDYEIATSTDKSQFIAEKPNKDVIENTGFDFCIMLNSNDQQNYTVQGTEVEINKTKEQTKFIYNSKLSVAISSQPAVDFLLNKPFLKLYNQFVMGKLKLKDHNTVYILPDSSFRITKVSRKAKITLVLTSVHCSYDSSSNMFNWVNHEGYLLIKKF